MVTNSVMKKISGYLIAIPMIVGTLTLIGWTLDIDILRQPYQGAISMNPMTALCFITSSVVFFLLYKIPRGKVPFPIPILLLLGVLTIGVLKLLSGFGIDMGVDRWLFAEKMHHENTMGHINRMAPNTALGLFFIGIAMLFSPLRVKWAERMVNGFMLVVFMVGLFAFIGFVYHIKEFYGILTYMPMALPSSICFICMSLGLLFENEDLGFMSVISSQNMGGQMARNLIPATLFIPIILGYIRLYISWQVPFAVELGVGLLVTSIIAMLLIIIWIMAKALNTSDEQGQSTRLQLEHEAQLFAILPDGVIYGNLDLSISNLNAAAERLFEVKLADAKERRLDELIKVEVIGTTRENIRKDLWNGSGYWRGELLFTTNAHRKINVLATLKVIKDETNANAGWVGIYTDITGLKAAEERLDLAIMGSAAGIWDWTDVPLDRRWWSPRYYELLGYEDKEIDPSISTLGEFLHPDDKEAVFKMLDDHLQHKGRFEMEYRMKAKSGEYKWFLGTAQARFDESGKPVRMVGSIVDINERKKAQHLVQQQADLIEMMPDGVIYGDMNNHIISMNKGAERMLDTTSEEAVGKKVEDIVGFKIIGQTRESSRMLLESGGYVRLEVELITRNGKNISVLATIKTFDNLIGSTPGWICVYTDISPLKLNDELQAANNYLEQLAFISAHDIKAPVLTLSGLTDLMARSKNLQASDIEILNMQRDIIQQMKNTNKALNEILQLRKNLQFKESKEGEVKPLKDIINNVMTILQPQINETGSRAEIDIDDIAELKLPLFYMQSVFHNLIYNSVKYRDPNRPLIIKVTCKKSEANTITFTVEDNGSGFDLRHNKEKVFGMFKRFHPQTDGTGVGLHMVKSIIDAYDGSIEIQSEPGVGTLFKIILKMTNLAKWN